MKKLLFSLVFAVGTLAIAADTTKVFRVVANNPDGQGTQLDLTLPISMIRNFQPRIHEALNHAELEVHGIDLVEMWQTIRETGPHEYAEISNEDANVRVYTNDTHLLIVVKTKDGDDIDARIPFELGDAIFQLTQDGDVEALIQNLERLENQELVTVKTSQGGDIKIWIE